MSDSRPTPHRSPWPIRLAAGLAVAGLVGFGVWLNTRSDESVPPAGPEFPIPPLSQTQFLNTGPDAHYIGSAACAGCHRTNHLSYLHTAHSRALTDLDPMAEPADATFRHDPSHRDYRVYRKDGQFRHEEVVRKPDGTEVARTDHPVRYLIGSGHFCRSYLVEVDGFLHQSPLTWYTTKGKWDMSPGYDFPQHWSFERPVQVGCLSCHAGRVEPMNGTTHQVAIHEQAIGCERCHGPGSLHAERYRDGQKGDGGDDWTIVNPSKLSRPLLEAVCADCHQSGAAAVSVRGRSPADFRPGRPITDYRVDYRFDRGAEQMTVVGHMEQLRLSKCYQAADTLTCLTCHDPHARVLPKDPMAFHRQKCLDCHADRGCSLPMLQRQAKQDACTTCHMPRGDTDIPHVAFTHHRIGKHGGKPAAASNEMPDLVPSDDVSHFPAIDRDRNLGLAYQQAAMNPIHERHAGPFRDRAVSLLEKVHRAGLKDGRTAEALAELYWNRDADRAGRFAREALAATDLSPEGRAKALIVLASSRYEDKDYGGAIELLEQLVKLRRFAEDWRLLGVCHLQAGRPGQALPALRQALAIRPTSASIHGALGETYRALGDTRRAREHFDKADWLKRNRVQ
jgi:hypothetical protein